MTQTPKLLPLVIQHLAVENVRNLQQVELIPDPGINLITGANGAGKTSLLEAIHILGRGRSFRSRRSNDWMTRGESIARIIAKTRHQPTLSTTLGLERDRNGWQARIDGRPVTSFGTLSRQLPLVMFEPNAHELVNGGPEQRRAYLDWGVFHVEPDYVMQWRRYHRALKQRNAALREQASPSVIQSLTPAMVTTAEQLDRVRSEFISRLEQAFADLYEQLQPELPEVKMIYQRGWDTKKSLSEQLTGGIQRDREAGFTRYGPHRCDIGLFSQQRQLRGWLSRGQQKLLALLMLLAQQDVWKSHSNDQQTRTPIILLDDLYSELDAAHIKKVLCLLEKIKAQTWITTTEQQTLTNEVKKVFHVEHGKVSLSE